MAISSTIQRLVSVELSVKIYPRVLRLLPQWLPFQVWEVSSHPWSLGHGCPQPIKRLEKGFVCYNSTSPLSLKESLDTKGLVSLEEDSDTR
jgi:hypothetical protein